MINVNGQRFYGNRSSQVCRLVCDGRERGRYSVSEPEATPPPPPVVLMTWGRPSEEPRPRRLLLAAHSSPPACELRPRRLSCCQIAAAVTALLVFYVVLLLTILYATGSMDALVASSSRSGRRGADALENTAEEADVAPWTSGSVDIERLELMHSPSEACSGRPPYLAAFVHSAPSHARHRAVVRRTWGAVRDVDGAGVRVVFVLGRPSSDDDSGTQSLIDAEARQFGDIVQADFVDTYRNLTIKHLLGQRWMLKHCGAANFFVKADDDAFVDVYQLVRFMKRTHGSTAPSTLVCNVLPAGTPVLRRGKWAVSRSELAADEYPRFCGGILYLAAPETARRLYSAARTHPHPLWVDDAFVTGLAAERAGVRHFFMNLRYTYEPDELHQWLEPERVGPLPYMVAHMDTAAPGWAELALRVWQKTLRTSQKA
ncbi:beta-1,3-galactosyltransferase 5-like isoform X1 [Amphibalanus amphitrite]|uniref:beta-1,3-galactosyltransferase 5-like isoform X1 n=2 Tax=Amphibalanus amphitrite TaxID=1232801 RepID=UPI001C8FA96A|nr:beta-1,3-galactosyltransferase 5-like isoform X1 [Amphibalanus amphitrite]